MHNLNAKCRLFARNHGKQYKKNVECKSFSFVSKAANNPSDAPAADGLVEINAMSSEIMHEIVEMIETEVQSRRTPIEFELAYQARVAIDRIRFAIKQTEQFAPHTDQMREVGLQLLDAMQRLESADRSFLNRLRAPNRLQSSHTPAKGLNGQAPRQHPPI